MGVIYKGLLNENAPSLIAENSARNPLLSYEESDIILNAPFEDKMTIENGSHVPQYFVKNL